MIPASHGSEHSPHDVVVTCSRTPAGFELASLCSQVSGRQGDQLVPPGPGCLVAPPLAPLQSWARAFFYASRLRFRALWRSSSRWRFRALFWALNFALLRSRFRAPALLDFSRSFFALLDFSRFFSRSLIFCARTFAIIDFRARNFVLVCLFTARIGQPGQDTQNKTARTGQPEQDRQNRTG